MINLQQSKEIIEMIRTADLELVRAILTAYVRQERFSEGTWAFAMEEKLFLTLLQRMKQLSAAL